MSHFVDENIFGSDTLQRDRARVIPEGQVTEADPLKLDLKDKDFVEVMDKRLKESREFFTKKDLYTRRERNQDYWLGQQIEKLKKKHGSKPHTVSYLDNVIFEAEGTLKAVAVGRVPDMIVTPGNDTDESRETADKLTEVINSRLRKRENRLVLGKAYTHRPIYFTGVIKYRWDAEKGKNGDYVFEVVHPNNIDVDHTASCNDTQEMDWIAHHYELSVKEILMRWPNKRSDLFKELKWDKDLVANEKKLASKLKISEIWFTWYDKKETGEGEDKTTEWIRIEGVAWKYKNVIFDKVKNPNWDWEGETISFTFDTESKDKRRVTADDIKSALLQGGQVPNMSTEKIYHNHFQNPRKPFIFLGFRQLGMQPYDETTRIEQSLLLQDNINVRGTQITQLSATAGGKDIYSTDSGMDAGDVEAVDRTDPEQDLLVDGPVRDVHAHIPGVLPTAALFEEQGINRERVFSKMGTNAALRGVREGPDPATKTQLFKESDFTRIDDEVEDTINAAAEQMSDAAMQMMKLFYTEDHMERLLGEEGITTFEKINRDLIEDGMEVEVSASSVDKLKRRREAFDLANTKMTDPLTFFRDIEATDPKGRTEKLMIFTLSPELYMQKFVEERDGTDQIAQALLQQPVGGEAPVVQPTPQGVPQGVV